MNIKLFFKNLIFLFRYNIKEIKKTSDTAYLGLDLGHVVKGYDFLKRETVINEKSLGKFFAKD